MRKLLFWAMTVVVMASCSNDDVVDVNKGDGISFRPSLDKALTRTNVTTLQNLAAFNVTAIGNGLNYFTDLGVTSTDNGTTWTTASTYYWPGYELKFFAYAPQTTGGTVSIGNASRKITGFSPAQAVANQRDLVISYNTGTKATNEGSGVAMNFKHALSQIEVKAKCSNDRIKIEVLGVKLVNAASRAEFSFPTTETKSDYILPQSQWSNWSEKNEPAKAYMIRGNTPVTLTADAQSIMFGDGNFMLIPQQLMKWDGSAAKTGAYLSVLCRISSLDGTNETLLYPQPIVGGNTKNGKYAFSAVGIDTNWEPGKKYTYTLNFCGNGGGAGEIDPTPTDPTNPTDPTIDPDPIPGGTGGDPVLGNPIFFTVSVDAWTDKTVEIKM